MVSAKLSIAGLSLFVGGIGKYLLHTESGTLLFESLQSPKLALLTLLNADTQIISDVARLFISQ